MSPELLAQSPVGDFIRYLFDSLGNALVNAVKGAPQGFENLKTVMNDPCCGPALVLTSLLALTGVGYLWNDLRKSKK